MPDIIIIQMNVNIAEECSRPIPPHHSILFKFAECVVAYRNASLIGMRPYASESR